MTNLNLPTKEQNKEFQKGSRYRPNFPDLKRIPAPEDSYRIGREWKIPAIASLLTLGAILGILFTVALLYFTGGWG